MKTQKLFIIICFVALTYAANAQEYAVDKKATFLSGMIGFSSQGGDLYSGNDNSRLTTILFAPSFSHFVATNFFIGGTVEFSSQSQDNESISSFAVGPHLGVAGGNASSTSFPYLALGLRYYNFDFGSVSLGGTDIALGVGVIVAIKSHLGLTIEGSYHARNLKASGADESISGNIISFGVGLTGLLFKSAAKK